MFNYIEKGNEYGAKERTKGNTKISPRLKNQLITLASAGQLNANGMIKELCLPIASRQVCKILKSTGHFKYTKKMVQPFLKPQHEEVRNYIHWSTE